MGLGDFASTGGIILLTKDPGEPALYWHQDWMQWNDPLSCSPWPQIIFVSYYLSDTSPENGCLKVIPGTHHKRISLHDDMVPAHEQGARFIEEDHPTMFSDHPDQVDVCVKAGDLVLADARVLHSAYRNPDRRTSHVSVGLASASRDGTCLLDRRSTGHCCRARPGEGIPWLAHPRRVAAIGILHCRFDDLSAQ